MKAAVYCRVSTDDQADAKTIQNQVDFARRYCDLHGTEIYGFYLDEGVSGALPFENRPAGARLMADALAGRFAAVYVYRLDRLARNTLDILRTHHKLSGVNVVLKSMTEDFDTSTPSGRFFMTTLGGIAEIERETIAERMRMGKQRALREGRWPGGPPPYGYALEQRRLVVNNKEAGIVRLIFKQYIQGGMSTADIAGYLNASGVPPPAAARRKKELPGKNRWHGSRVWSILSNQIYKGFFLFGQRSRKDGAPVVMEIPALVSEKEWEAAREKKRYMISDAKRNTKRQYLLKGLVRCGICGRVCYGDGSGKSGRHCYYRCAGTTSGRGRVSRCGALSVRADLLEEVVWNDVTRFILTSDQALEHILGAAPVCGGGDVDGREGGALLKKVMVREKQREKIISLFRREIISEEDLRKELQDLNREINALEKRRQAVARLSGRRMAGGGLMENLRQRLLAACFEDRRELVRGLVDSVVIDTIDCGNKKKPRARIYYVFNGMADCAPHIETRGKYRLGVPKSSY